ncbi:MAG: exo-alpha-sialidase [Opitutaceae bacterium]|nr:exo-alpha-sialidase [Opitutaceae bacterium]
MKNALLLLGLAALLAPAAIAGEQPSSVQHVVVYHEPGRFGGWPANSGIWSWGDEIAVGFTRAWFLRQDDEHSRDKAKPAVTAIARSRDGGVSWTIEEHPELAAGEPRPSPGGIDFTHPGFALRVRDGAFSYSYDRARTWQGPFALPDFQLGDRLTSRTDYLVNSASDCLLFLSVKDTQVQSGIPDRAFAVRTRDGGKTFRFEGWMTGAEPPVARSVMPATVRAADGSLVTTLRRRYDLKSEFRNDINWIDAFGSRDDGLTWNFLARIAYTDHTGRNGNPPSLVRLPDDRLAVAYGVRSSPPGIRARVSSDSGRTWGDELVLRDDARTWDIGYCRSVVRADGRIVTVYYYATRDLFENHIAATIWSPPAR